MNLKLYGSALREKEKKNNLGLNGLKNDSEHWVFSCRMMKGKVIELIF